MFSGDDPAAADLQVAELPTAHLVVEQVPRQSGDGRGLVRGVGQPLLKEVSGAGGGDGPIPHGPVSRQASGGDYVEPGTRSASSRLNGDSSPKIALVARST